MAEKSYIRRVELDYINAVACLLVILIHVLSYGIANADPTSWQAAAVYFPWRLAGFVVPVFLFTGAVKMALFFGSTEITVGVYLRYIWERIRNIYFPYVVWVVIYYLCFYAMGYVEGSFSELISGIFAGILLFYIHYSMKISLLDLDDLKIITDIMSILLIWAVCVKISGKAVRVERLLSRIGKASYQVYLSHCLFLTLGTAVQEGYLFNLTEIVLLRFAIGYTVPFLLYFSWRKVTNGVRRWIINRSSI